MFAPILLAISEFFFFTRDIDSPLTYKYFRCQ